MRKRIIDWIFTLQSQRGILGEKERRLYTYAYGLLLNKIAIYAIIAIVGTITGNWIGMFSFLLPFTILRQYAGGIHLEKPMNCIIFSGFLVFGCGQYLAVASDIGKILCALWVAAILLIFVLAPIDTKGKKLDKTAKKIYGRRARGVLVIEVMIAICFWVCGFIVVTKAAKRWSWDDLLKEMMKTPTIRGVAKILSNQAGENEQDKSLVIIKEAAESSEKKVTVVFHAGTGTLTPYNSLIAYITERSQENEAVMGFTFGDEAEYLAIPTDKIFENLGKKYGRILSELGFTEYTLIGHCVGGLIALETAHYLKDKGKNVSSVTLLSTSIPHKKEETVLADLDMKIFETAVQTSLYNELLLERTFASLIDADIKKAGHQVDNDTLQQVIEYLIFNNGGNITVQALCSLTGKFAEVGAEFQRLHSMSATERMNDLYTTIERPNGQLMEHQRKMLNVLFRVFAQNFRCVSSYIPKVYTGKMRVFDCESAIANFFPSLFSEDKKTWEQYAQGEFLFDTMKGDHISCMNSPYIEENVKKILDL